MEESLMAGCKMYTDNDSIKQYLYLVKHWIMDTLSTIAVEQKTGKLAGFLICRFKEVSSRDPEFSKESVIIIKSIIKYSSFINIIILNIIFLSKKK